MIFVIGGYAQGRKEYIRDNFPNAQLYSELDAQLEELYKTSVKSTGKNTIEDEMKAVIVDRDKKIEGLKEHLLDLIEREPELIIDSSEIGNGLVPIEKSDRDYRDGLGAMQVWLAERADQVIRIVCGIGQRIK